MKIIFVRHGEPLKSNYGISEIGKKEMYFLAKYLKNNFSIKHIYSATSTRAKESVCELNKNWGKKIIYYDWLNESKYKLVQEGLYGDFLWELAPEIWINDDSNLDYKISLESKILQGSEVKTKVQLVWRELDKLISDNGYNRYGNLYNVIKGNKEEIIIVTHFATMAIMIAHLLNISIFISLNMLFMAPSSYTVLATEEIQKGKVIFRCLELGSTKHLYGKNGFKSEYGRQDEVKEK